MCDVDPGKWVSDAGNAVSNTLGGVGNSLGSINDAITNTLNSGLDVVANTGSSVAPYAPAAIAMYVTYGSMVPTDGGMVWDSAAPVYSSTPTVGSVGLDAAGNVVADAQTVAANLATNANAGAAAAAGEGAGAGGVGAAAAPAAGGLPAALAPSDAALTNTAINAGLQAATTGKVDPTSLAKSLAGNVIGSDVAEAISPTVGGTAANALGSAAGSAAVGGDPLKAAGLSTLSAGVDAVASNISGYGDLSPAQQAGVRAAISTELSSGGNMDAALKAGLLAMGGVTVKGDLSDQSAARDLQAASDLANAQTPTADQQAADNQSALDAITPTDTNPISTNNTSALDALTPKASDLTGGVSTLDEATSDAVTPAPQELTDTTPTDTGTSKGSGDLQNFDNPVELQDGSKIYQQPDGTYLDESGNQVTSDGQPIDQPAQGVGAPASSGGLGGTGKPTGGTTPTTPSTPTPTIPSTGAARSTTGPIDLTPKFFEVKNPFLKIEKQSKPEGLQQQELKQLFSSLDGDLQDVLASNGAAPTQAANGGSIHGIHNMITPELLEIFASRLPGYASGGSTMQSVMDDLSPKYVKQEPKFFRPSGGLQNPIVLAKLAQLKDAPKLGGLAQGGLPAKYEKAAPKGHNPEFITGLTGYYAGGRGTGQSDDIPAMLHEGDYVIDADAVSALGDGSSKAGRDALLHLMHQVPHDPRPGGKPIPAKIADGEMVLPESFVTALGGGDNKRGAKWLDEMRENLREHKRSAPTSKIPPKAKSPLEYLKMAKG